MIKVINYKHSGSVPDLGQKQIKLLQIVIKQLTANLRPRERERRTRSRVQPDLAKISGASQDIRKYKMLSN